MAKAKEKKTKKLPKALSMAERSAKEDALLEELGGGAFETEIDGVTYDVTADGLKPLTGPQAQKIVKRKRKRKPGAGQKK